MNPMKDGHVDLGAMKERGKIMEEAQFAFHTQFPELIFKVLDQHNVLLNSMANALHGIRYTLIPPMEKFHVPVIAPVNIDRPDHRWRVYCLACSEIEANFVYPCLVGGDTTREVATATMPSVDVMHIPPSMRHGRDPVLRYTEKVDVEVPEEEASE